MSKPTIRTTGRNIWIDIDGTIVAVSETRPTPRHEGDGVYAAYNPRRVRGNRYEYYTGSSEWVEAANASMAEQAAYNGRNR